MICRKNELGWRLHKSITGGYTIRQPDVPWHTRLTQLGPVLVNLLVIAAFHYDAGTVLRYTLYAVPFLLLVLWAWAGRLALRIAWAAAAPLAIFIGLLARDTMDVSAACGALPFSLLIGLVGFRPFQLFVNPKARLVVEYLCSPQLPFSRVKVVIRADTESDTYGVYLLDAEPPSQCPPWQVLAWKAGTEAEARDIADQFRSWGIEAPEPPVTAPVIEADRKLRLLFIAGHILSVVIFIAFLVWAIPLPLQGPEPQALLRIVRYTIAFLFLSPVPFALHLCWLGRRAIRHRQMPPPATKLLFNTKPLAGNQAVKRGRLLIAAGLTIISLGLTLGLYLPQKLTAPLRQQLNQTAAGAHP